MFESISPSMLSRMRELEAIDLRDRTDGTPQSKRLRQIPPEVGKFIALLAASSPAAPCLRLAPARDTPPCGSRSPPAPPPARSQPSRSTPRKVELARATFAAAGVTDLIDLVHGDALTHLAQYNGIGFCFLDAEKDLYDPCYELAVPRMVPGGILVADNAISHQAELRPMLDRALRDERVDAVLVPIGTGDLVCRKK